MTSFRFAGDDQPSGIEREPAKHNDFTKHLAGLLAANEFAGLTEISVAIFDDSNKLDDYAQISENRHRLDLTPLEEAAFKKKRLAPVISARILAQTCN